eukprot:Sspe_Gene.118013::Locus_110476_Transcript_2_2_Confidence_0.800_Length_736::g.118013::m.118013
MTETSPLVKGVVVPQVVVAAPAKSLPSAWMFDPFSCFQDMGVCCDVMCCTLCQLSRQCSAVKEDIADDMNWPVCCALTLLPALIPPAGILSICFAGWHIRHTMRKKHNLMGDACEDLLMTLCCFQCMLCQQNRELTARGISPGLCCCKPSNTSNQTTTVVVQYGYPAAAPVAAPPPASYE